MFLTFIARSAKERLIHMNKYETEVNPEEQLAVLWMKTSEVKKENYFKDENSWFYGSFFLFALSTAIISKTIIMAIRPLCFLTIMLQKPASLACFWCYGLPFPHLKVKTVKKLLWQMKVKSAWKFLKCLRGHLHYKSFRMKHKVIVASCPLD